MAMTNLRLAVGQSVEERLCSGIRVERVGDVRRQRYFTRLGVQFEVDVDLVASFDFSVGTLTPVAVFPPRSTVAWNLMGLDSAPNGPIWRG